MLGDDRVLALPHAGGMQLAATDIHHALDRLRPSQTQSRPSSASHRGAVKT
jgi:hypothetical protein